MRVLLENIPTRAVAVLGAVVRYRGVRFRVRLRVRLRVRFKNGKWCGCGCGCGLKNNKGAVADAVAVEK